jgi:hypothetical protein
VIWTTRPSSPYSYWQYRRRERKFSVLGCFQRRRSNSVCQYAESPASCTVEGQIIRQLSFVNVKTHRCTKGMATMIVPSARARATEDVHDAFVAQVHMRSLLLTSHISRARRHSTPSLTSLTTLWSQSRWPLEKLAPRKIFGDLWRCSKISTKVESL